MTRSPCSCAAWVMVNQSQRGDDFAATLQGPHLGGAGAGAPGQTVLAPADSGVYIPLRSISRSFGMQFWWHLTSDRA